MAFSPVVSIALQLLAIVVLGLVAGSMFGTWRGYDVAQYSPAAFLEVHQGSVRGLNLLLPAMGLAALLLTATLAVLARSHPGTLWLYVASVVLIATAALITRFGNQPINQQVMAWTSESLPENWQTLRDAWSNWHLARFSAATLALVFLTLAVLNDRAATAVTA